VARVVEAGYPVGPGVTSVSWAILVICCLAGSRCRALSGMYIGGDWLQKKA
jgi:hypothetical protein